MPQIPFIGTLNAGRSKSVNAQKRQNIYLDVLKDADKTRVAAYGTPGKRIFTEFGAYPARGMWRMQSTDELYIVADDKLYRVNILGQQTLIGTLQTTQGRVGMSDNGFQLIIVDGPNGYIYTHATGIFERITSDGWQGGETVVFLDSYFIVSRPDSGQFAISGQYDGLAWNALDFATAESSPDNLIAVNTDNGNLALYGEISAELWADSGNNDFPFAKVSGAALEYGLAARWSLARVAGAPMMLIRNRRGQFSIGALNGYQWSPVSTPDVDFEINSYQSPEDAQAFSYYQGGHEFYQITFGAAGKTWLYDATSGTWSTLKSYGITRDRANLGTAFKVGILVSDFEDGRIYWLDPTAYTEAGNIIERELIAPHGFDPGDLNMTICNLLRIDMEGGVGDATGQGFNPRVMLQISRDGGHTYGSELWREIGKQGEHQWRAEWWRLGMARSWVLKLRMSDPVKFALIGAYADFEVCNK